MKDTSIRGGKPHTSNSDGTGGRSSGSPSAQQVAECGVQYKTRITETPGELGMSTVGMSEKPEAVAKHTVEARGKKFNFR